LSVDSKGRIAEVSTRIVEELQKRDILVIFDEANYLTDNTMEYLRIAINDKGHSGLVFVGLKNIEHRIKNLKNDHRQLENRIGICLGVDDVSDEDAAAVVRAVWPEVDEPIIQTFWKAARKNLHSLINHITLTKRSMRALHLENPTLEVVADSARLLMK
jgi:hypothetical protein